MGEITIPLVKQQLEQEMGPENFKKYLELLQEWFGQRMAKCMFDFEVENLFGERSLKLHNQLMHCILLVSYGGPSGLVSPPLAESVTTVPCSQPSTTTKPKAKKKTKAKAVKSIEPPCLTQPESVDRNDYIMSPIPDEEPCIYPESAREYQNNYDNQRLVDVIEQDPPPECDWLSEVKLTYPVTDDENIPDISMKNRFPPWFAVDFQTVHKGSYTHEVNIVRNVTHLSSMVRDLLERKPHLKQHFVVPYDKMAPYLTSGCSLYGRILTKAWDRNIQNVNLLVTEYAVKAVKENIKSIIVSMLKQRRPFRMRDKRIIHSVGIPYPNPYLRQGCHLYDEAYGTDTTKMADVVMQVPTPFLTLEENERLSALQVAASSSLDNIRYNSAKGTMMDLLLAIQQNPSLIPNHVTRHKILDLISRKNKGFDGSHNSQYSTMEEDEDDDILLQSSPILPVASY